VIVTAGDGFPKAAAAHAGKELDRLVADDYLKLASLRQRHSLQAMKRLNVKSAELVFLGYPDGGMAKLYAAADDPPYRQPMTGKSETYGSVVADYHQRVHGQPAPYTHAALLGDLTEIIKTRQPGEIYVTGEADVHPDHRAAFCFVRDAARAAGFGGKLWTYIVHGNEPSQPPDRRLALTESELQFKRTLLEGYQVGVSPVHDDLAARYTRPEERFWAEK
jgi:LmbE family N-acetylglucosaminyl deacetylase